ncbi:MAG: hypothetical protein HUU49_02340 [Candidatus Buchananbacteria bacterium]|nr:hypothetical protein [Candidatus Buchananbacteria bacterium]
MVLATGNPHQVSGWKIKLSYWYVSHKIRLRQALIVLLMLLSVLLYGYSLYKVLMILVVEDKNFKQDLSVLSLNLIDYSYFRQANKPLDIQILSFDALGGREGRYDFVAQVQNPNEDWVAAEVDFQLLSGTNVVAEKSSFIYPQEIKYLAFFGEEVSTGFTPVIKINRIKWRRFNNFAAYGEPRLRFTISDINFKPASSSGIRGELPVSTLSFQIKNDTAFSYWNVGLYMALVNGNRPIAANFIKLDQFYSGESRTVDIRWYESLGSAGKVEVKPEVDILNSDSYMPVE